MLLATIITQEEVVGDKFNTNKRSYDERANLKTWNPFSELYVSFYKNFVFEIAK